LRVTSSSPEFQKKVDQTGNGQFKIDIQPRDTSRNMDATLIIQPESSTKTFYAKARVTNAAAIQ